MVSPEPDGTEHMKSGREPHSVYRRKHLTCSIGLTSAGHSSNAYDDINLFNPHRSVT